MVRIDFGENFIRTISKIKNKSIKLRVEKLLYKIKDNPKIGKPMKHNRKGTRELYFSPFRLSYAYDKNNEVIVIPELYHKDKQ